MISRLRIRGMLAASVILLGVALTGCKTPKNVAYFQDVTENVVTIPSGQASKIMPNDRLSIIVKTKDPGMTQLFNKSLPYDRIGEGYSDYFVSPEGTIDFPMLGELKVTGMTRDELAAFIKGELIGKGYIKEAIVSVDIINLGFSVLGEVNKPGFFGLIKEEMTLLEALSLAGDMTVLGQRENVKLIRKTPEGAKTYTVDLTNYGELAKSPAYYVEAGDVIYVEPNNVRKRETTSNGNNVTSVAFWVSVASLLTSVLVLIKK